ncbi:MAG: tRNA (adenosine(37)-N6)-threonylcarbamoyltransferase complex ATPase subunit type 1 TsaE [Flavobacteriales bacterium]
MEFEVTSLEDLKVVAKSILDSYPLHKVFLLYGEMGAGKTTLTKEFCEILKCEGYGSSPTFSIVNEYHSVLHKKIYHFDCYRLNNENEAFDIGIEDYLDSNYYCFIEWPEKIFNLLPAKHICISIKEENLVRTITVSEEK